MLLLIFIGLVASTSTFFGGVFALRFKDRLHLILGFSAGAVIGVAFFDLLPEAINIGAKYHSNIFITTVIATGFLVYMLVDRAVSLHSCGQENCEKPTHKINKGVLGAISFSFHSFLDGMAVGFAFQISAAVGVVVAAAVIAHDFSDGVNTVNQILKNSGRPRQAFRWLAIDALAPLAGVISTLFFRLPETIVGIILAIFCGFFLYIGASDLLPETHHSHAIKLTTFMTVLGILVIYAAVRLAGL